MALKHPLVVHNYAKNGYYPTDAASVKRINPVLTTTQNQIMTLLDPCAGEGTDLSVIALGLGKTAKSYIVEYDKQRCDLTAQITDKALCSYILTR